MPVRNAAALLLAASFVCLPLASAQDAPYHPNERTLLLDHFDDAFTPDGKRCTSPEVIRPTGDHTGGRAMKGCEFVNGKFGKAFRFHGLTKLSYPVAGNLDLSAGQLEFWVRMGFEPDLAKVPNILRNQLFFQVDGPGPAIFSVYSCLKTLCVGVWDQKRQLVCYLGTPSPWHKGEWHHVQVRWGRQLELWMDGERRGAKDWVGMFGPMNFGPEELRMYLGSRIGYSTVESEFAVDELRVLGPGGEQAPPYPVITCPRLLRPPRIDGVLEEGEWDAAGRTTGFVGLNENSLVEDQTAVFVGHDAENLYVAFKCTDPQKRPLECTLTGRDSAVYKEDAVDIFIQPGPGTYPYYQLVTNCIGARFDMKLIEQARRRAKVPEFDPEWTVKTTRGEGRWVAETVIPFSELDGHASPTPGETWRVNFCRDADAASRLSSWAYTSGNFHRPSNFGALVFRADDRAMRLSELSGTEQGQVRVRLDLVGAAFDPPVRVISRLVDAGAKVVSETAKELVDSKSFLLLPPPLVSGSYALTLEAKSREGTLLYQRLPFQVMKPYDISVAGYPYEGKLWITANVAGLEAAPEGVIARASLTDGAKELGSCEVRDFDRGIGRGAMDITDLSPGQYTVKSQAVAPDGKVLAAAEAAYEQFAKPVWWRSDVGIDNTVPVPWTAVQSAAGTIKVWGREYRFGDGIMPQQIVNQGREVLSGPLQLAARIGGKHVDLARLVARDLEAPQDRAIREATGEVGPITVNFRVTTEFDGLQRCDLTFTPHGKARIEALTLEVPVKREFATFLLPSNGRFAKAQLVGGEPWRSAFLPQVWVGNDDLGLAWFAESDQYWSPLDDQMLEVSATGDTVTMRANIIRQPLTIAEPVTITFGLMATPVKPVPSGDPFYYRFGGPRNAFNLWDAEQSVMTHVESLVYPGAGNLDPHQGTLEFWLSAAGAEGRALREIVSIIGAGGSVKLTLNHGARNMTLTASAGDQQQSVVAGEIEIPTDAFAHVAITWGERTELYVDGVRRGPAEGPLPGAQQMAAAPEKLKLVFGCTHSYKGYTWVDVDELRVSNTVRYAGDSFELPAAPFEPDANTLLLDHLDDRFKPDGEDAETRAEVVSGQSDELGGVPSLGCKFVAGKFNSGLRIAMKPPRWSVEILRDEWGANAYNLWSWMDGEQQQRWGWPLPLFTDPGKVDLPRMNQAFAQAGVRTSTYMAYVGIGAPTRWSGQFGYEWRREPVSSQPNEPPKGHYFLDCCGNARGYRDYLAAGTKWLLEDQGFDGCYTDGNAHVYPCKNTHHGCGYYDDQGILHATWPIFGTREYLKRMYKIIHAKRPDGYLVNHVSYDLFIPTMSFTDVYYTGEHEHYEDLLKCRVRWQGTQWGIWPILLGGDSHCYEAMHWTYGLLHGVGVWPQGPYGRNDMQRKTVNLWKTYDAFGYREAEWVPYYRAEERGLARASDDQVKVSVYLHRGKRALLVVGNLKHEVTSCRVLVDPRAMGLPEGAKLRAYNALSERELLMEGNAMSVRLRPTSFVLARVELR